MGRVLRTKIVDGIAYGEVKGDTPGHPFRGNQFTSGESMGADQLRDHIGMNHGVSLSVQQPGVRSLVHLQDLHAQMHEGNPRIAGATTEHTHAAAVSQYRELYGRAYERVHADNPEWDEDRKRQTAQRMVDAYLSGTMRR
jgi:hypothetical protein